MTVIQNGPLSRGKVAAHVADVRAEIEGLRHARDAMQDTADDVQRTLLTRQSQLTEFQKLVDERGLVDDDREAAAVEYFGADYPRRDVGGVDDTHPNFGALVAFRAAWDRALAAGGRA